MSVSYYEKEALTHTDGTVIRVDASVLAGEADAASRIERAWRCRLVSYPLLHPLDWYAVRDERMVAVVELKTRTHAYGTFDTTVVDAVKWDRLRRVSEAETEERLVVRGILVVQFTDGLWWIAVDRLPNPQRRLLRRRSRDGQAADAVEVVEIPLAELTRLG